ncbi:MAG: hypothetical protein CM15mP70_08290 [Pelagibacteraceae bacterium]|nr:MAG: hypothetical protein CM15mP70_08290 [Pelagibacteraceae bacterium]
MKMLKSRKIFEIELENKMKKKKEESNKKKIGWGKQIKIICITSI